MYGLLGLWDLASVKGFNQKSIANDLYRWEIKLLSYSSTHACHAGKGWSPCWPFSPSLTRAPEPSMISVTSPCTLHQRYLYCVRVLVFVFVSLHHAYCTKGICIVYVYLCCIYIHICICFCISVTSPCTLHQRYLYRVCVVVLYLCHLIQKKRILGIWHYIGWICHCADDTLVLCRKNWSNLNNNPHRSHGGIITRLIIIMINQTFNNKF